MPSVYLETTILSYLAAKPSRDVIAVANQQITQEWWNFRRQRYDLYISQAVITECSGGDPVAAKKRLEIANRIAVLELTQEVQNLAKVLITEIPLPEKAQVDAIHIAIAAANAVDYLMTWNCTHIANAVFAHKIENICIKAGFDAPTICTPQQLMEG